MFNEGYSASNGEEIIRVDLCKESIRLAEMVAGHKWITNKSDAYALIALMQLNASRFKARTDENGNIITLSQQDRSLWDLNIMEQGFSNLEKASHSQQISKYHILATISAYHCFAKDFASTDWKSILTLYDKLLSINNSPLVILNRAIALSNLGKVAKAIQELESIENKSAVSTNHLYYSTKADFYIQMQDHAKALAALKRAIELAPLLSEKRLLENRYQRYFENN